MQLRRSLALTTAAVALATTGLSSCGFSGFEYATDREYTPSVGVNDRDGAVDVLGAVIVSTEPGSGTFVASLSNNSLDSEVTMTEVGLAEGSAPAPAEFTPVLVKPGALVNLAEPATDIKLTGEFEAGHFVKLAIGFDNGESVEVEVPVVTNGGYYSDLDGPAPAEEPAEEPAGEGEAPAEGEGSESAP